MPNFSEMLQSIFTNKNS